VSDPVDDSGGSLAGIRILDFSRILAGPFATMILADLGASVTKVERPGTGDETRGWGPPYDHTGTATYFLAVNRNKESVALDLRTTAGVEQALSLAASSDVIVENFRPGVMERLGLGYDILAARNPSLIYCSISAFGRHGGADLPGYDLIVQAMGGLMSITGSPDGEPQKVGVALVDVIGGLFAVAGMLAALRHRDRTGVGQRVEIDLLTSLLAGLANQSAAFTASGVVAQRMGNEHPSISPYELLATQDGQLAVAVGNDRQFLALCTELGRPELAGDVRFSNNDGRVRHRTQLRQALTELLAGNTTRAWAERLASAGVPAGPVNDIAGAFELARHLGLDPTVEMPRADGTSVVLPRNPIALSVTPATYRSAPPPLPE
jgi:crotonobetainyl-CoA:carnitine CoA-transferase CaiB-like acyl-CoA transferase